MSELFYLQCTRSIVGNSVMWWAIDDRGYTCDIRCAKVWTKEEIENKTMREIDKPWPKQVIDRLVQHHVDFQDLKFTNNNGEQALYPHTIAQWRPDLVALAKPHESKEVSDG